MNKLTRDDLLSLEAYADCRDNFRREVMAHKTNRQVKLGNHIRLLFEDRLTMQYQIQEMLRAERIFEADAIQEELDTYNPLIPDGGNWKATMLIEYDDVEQRRQALAELIGVERKVWVRVNGYEPVYAIADEDLERDNEEKTSSVHFLRFELTPEMQRSVLNIKTGVKMGVDHPQYSVEMAVPEGSRSALMQDIDES
ncbi:DUF3501 family protein [Pontibacterium granulatum]|uniref:DUF3501 family protein n=1 Tax=Pontibacterium granulatum TaxID=2036029 RepID=UPI00249C4689|nr:DUF3501 family protein [Pontibacterium granulatum]MDI3323078.1 DUF3501 family protein [Pontibacterium granulatum]